MTHRIREIRKSQNLSQEAFALLLGTTQQAISRIENNQYDIPTDLLLKISQIFNVTTDYILGNSDIKRNDEMQSRMDNEMDEYYDFIQQYQRLDPQHQEALFSILKLLIQLQNEH